MTAPRRNPREESKERPVVLMAAKKVSMVQVSQERIRTGTADNICPSLDMKEIMQRTCPFSCEEGIASVPTTTVLHLTPDPGGVGNAYRAF